MKFRQNVEIVFSSDLSPKIARIQVGIFSALFNFREEEKFRATITIFLYFTTYQRIKIYCHILAQNAQTAGNNYNLPDNECDYKNMSFNFNLKNTPTFNVVARASYNIRVILVLLTSLSIYVFGNIADEKEIISGSWFLLTFFFNINFDTRRTLNMTQLITRE